MPAVANHCPPASGVREVTQSSIHQRLTCACYPVGLAEARGFELCYPGHAVEFKLHSDTVLPLEVKKLINTNPFGHEKVASRPLQRGPATAGRRAKVGPRCGVRWPVEQGSLVRWWCLQNPTGAQIIEEVRTGGKVEQREERNGGWGGGSGVKTLADIRL